MSIAHPVLFVSHGAPTFAIEPGQAGAKLGELGKRLTRPKAIVVVSPHWMTRGSVLITASATPETIHDFGGFPAALYQLRYPAPGEPALAERIRTLLSSTGWAAETDPRRGLDHGAWVPLLHLAPQADIPVVQVSLPYSLDPEGAWQLGQALQPLREEGVLIIGSGGLTHNLYEFRGGQGQTAEYVTRFAGWIADQLHVGNLPALFDYRERAPEAARAHPSEEHLLPLFVALGAAGTAYAMQLIEGGVTYGVLAMDSYLFDTPANVTDEEMISI